MKRGQRTAAALAALCIAGAMTACSGGGSPVTVPAGAADPAFDFRYDKTSSGLKAGAGNRELLASFEVVKESDTLVLYADKATSNVAVEDKRNGRVWSTIPLDLDGEEPPATADKINLLRSALRVDYNNVSKLESMYSYTDCVSAEDAEKFVTEPLDNGIRMIFHMGKTQITFDDLPKVMSDERFSQFFVNHEALEENDKIRVGRYFKFNEEKQLWEMTSTTSTTLRALYEIMQKVGYTEEELQYDYEDNGLLYTGGDKVFFNVVVDYILQNDSLIVDIPLGELEYNTAYPPVVIAHGEMLMHSRKGEGSILVPDGGGALIDFSKDETDKDKYSLSLYGQDVSISNFTEDAGLSSCMPVYGMYSGNGGALAVIEDGDAFATITAIKAYTESEYNSVGAYFTVTARTLSAIGDGSQMQQVPVLQKHLYQGSLRTRHVFFGEECTYAEMAMCYKAYLMHRDGLEDTGLAARAEMSVELIGAIEVTQSVFGIKYDGVRALTTFDQAEEIVARYAEEGVTGLYVQFSGAVKGGLDNYYLKNAKLLSSLGGSKGYRSLSDAVTQAGGRVYLSNSFTLVPQTSGGFSKLKNAVRTVDQSVGKIYNYDLVTTDKLSLSNIVSPRHFTDYMKEYAGSIGKRGVDALAFSDLGGFLYSDYSEKATVTRQNAKQLAAEALKYGRENMESLMLSAPVMDNVKYADVLVSVPLYSNEKPIFSRSVPFAAMVLSGLTPFSGEVYNEADDREYLRLKMAETGAMPYFSLFYEANTVLRNTGYTYLTSNNYELWIEDSIALYKEHQAMRDKLAGASISGHEELSKNVYKTEYSNGWSVIVNYTGAAVSVGNQTVEAKDYALVREG